MKQNPELIVFTGPMFGGKTSRLLAALDRYKYQGKVVAVFKPKMDDRYSEHDVKTHAGNSIEALAVKNGDDILQHVITSNVMYDVIAIDEAFMLDDIADAVITLYRTGYTVVLSSLEMSGACNVFEEVSKLLAWATKIEKLPAVCTICQRDAFYTHRKEEGMAEIQVGGADMYEPRCWEHHTFTNMRDS